MSAVSRVELRPLTEGDHAAVQALMHRTGWPQRSQAGWLWALRDNPARLALGADTPLGWVLSDGSRLLGYLGNLPQQYVCDGQWLMGATCTSYVVLPEARAHSASLMRALFSQKGVDLAYTTTANEHSGPVYQLYKAQTLNDPGLQETRVWVGDLGATARQALNKLHLGWMKPCVPWLTPAMSWVQRGLGLASPPPPTFKGEVRPTDPAAIDARFDQLWLQLQAQPGLWLDRRAATLRWRLSDPDQPGLSLLAAQDAHGLAGWIISTRYQGDPGLAGRRYVLDLAWRPDCPEAVGALLQAVCAQARDEGLALVEAFRFAGPLGAALASQGGHVRPVPGASHWVRHLARRPDYPVKADTPWALGGMDGDFWFGLVNRSQSGPKTVA